MTNMNNNGRFEPYRATRFWKEMQLVFRQQVPLRRKLRSRKKEETDCFSGQDAVKTMFNVIQTKQQEFGLREVTTEKATKVLQILLTDGFFEAVGQSTEDLKGNSQSKKPVFMDIPTALYRFSAGQTVLGDDDPCLALSPAFLSKRPISNRQRILHLTPDDCRKKALEAGIIEALPDPQTSPRTKFRSPITSRRKIADESSPLLVRKAFPPKVEEDVHMRSPTPLKKKEERDVYSEDLETNMSAISGLTADSSISFDDDELHQIDDDLLYDAALFRLLTLVEIPILDGILHVKEKGLVGDPGTSHSAIGFLDQLLGLMSLSSSAHRQPSVVDQDIQNLCEYDPWMRAGLRCLFESERQNCITELTKLYSAKSVPKLRLYAFSQVADHFRRLTKDSALIPTHLSDFVMEIDEQHLSKGRQAQALESCQLLLLLLPSARRQQVQSLMQFVAVVGTRDKDTRLSTQLPNAVEALSTLGEVVIRTTARLTRGRTQAVLSFFVANVRDLFDWPLELRRELKQRVRKSQYTVAVPVPGVSYCARISPVEFEKQKLEESEFALVQLVNAVIDHQSMSLEMKKTWLVNFRSAYPELYGSHFRNLAW